ncbi:hypothetical protein [Thioclava sp. GXIMD4215]|uniref:hypothetical protein n=1 Tax=Thioclava sp. GXIMD4215 TaxID=3131928 RepID=UPI00324B8205
MTQTPTNAPERIWADMDERDGNGKAVLGEWFWTPHGPDGVEYVRADLIERLTAERDALQMALGQGYQEAHDKALSALQDECQKLNRSLCAAVERREYWKGRADDAKADCDERVRQEAWAEAMTHLDKQLNDALSRRMTRMDDLTDLECRCLCARAGEYVGAGNTHHSDVQDAYRALRRKGLLNAGLTVEGHTVLAEIRARRTDASEDGIKALLADLSNDSRDSVKRRAIDTIRALQARVTQT